MAHVSVCRRWPDGDVLQIIVKAEASYSDAIAEARANAIKAFREAHDVMIPVEAETDGNE